MPSRADRLSAGRQQSAAPVDASDADLSTTVLLSACNRDGRRFSVRCVSVPANVQSLIVLFWRRLVTPRAMAAAVRVDRSARGETRVRIEAPVAWPPFRRRGQGFRITTTPLALRTDHFPEATARRGVAYSKEKKRGRV